MNFKSTIIIGVLLLAIGAYAYFIEYKGGEKKKEKEEQSKVLLEIKKEDVSSIKLVSSGKTIEIHPAGKDKWEISAPFKTPADDSTIGSLLGNLEKLKYKDIVAEKPADLSQYDLNPPSSVITIGLKKGGEKVLKLGAKSPVDSVRYSQIQGDPRVYTIDSSVADSAGTSLFDLRDKKLTNFSSDQVRMLAIHTAKIDLRFNKESEVWKMTQPVASPASDTQVNSVLSSLEYLRATSFEDNPSPDLKSYGLDQPAATLELTLDKGLHQKISFGNKMGSDIYVMMEGNPTIAKVNDAFTAELEKPLESWRETKVLVFNRFDVEELRVKSAGKEYVFKKEKDEKWSEQSPAKGEVPEDKVQAIMEKIENAEIDHYGEPATLAEAAGLEIGMTLKDWQNNVTKKHLAFGPAEGNLLPVKNDDYGTLIYTNGAIQVEITKALADIKPAAKK